MNKNNALCAVLLILIFTYVSFTCKTVSFCGDSFANNCTPLNGESRAVSEEEEEEVVLTYTVEDATVLGSKKIPLTPQQQALLEIKKKMQNKYFAGNIVLSDGRCVTSCAWFGETGPNVNENGEAQICGDCAKRFIVYTPPELYQCYQFPATIRNGTISLADVNTIKQGCATIGTCKCKDGEIAQSDKLVLLLQALNAEVKATINEINVMSTQLRSDIADTTNNLKLVMAQYESNARPCLGKIDIALQNITIAYDKGVDKLMKSKADYEKTIAKKGATYNDKTFSQKLTQIMKLKATFVNLFKKKLVHVLGWLSKCKHAIKLIAAREEHKKKLAAKKEAQRIHREELKRKREEQKQAREEKLRQKAEKKKK